MDLIKGLPRTRRHHDSIWVIVDRMTKSSHFLAVKTKDSAEDAKLYINEIVRLHGVPFSLISDRYSVYLSFRKSFQKGLGTQVNLSTTFHPQTDGLAERTILTLEDMLRACMIDFKGSWDYTFLQLSLPTIIVTILAFTWPLMRLCMGVDTNLLLVGLK